MTDADPCGSAAGFTVLLNGPLPPHAGTSATVTADQIASGLDLPELPDRPYVMLNMIASADGRATVGARTARLGSPADRQLFHALRAVFDGVIVGAGTARQEHYQRLIRQESVRAARCARGLSPEPLACIVSDRLYFGQQVPLLAEPSARVAIITASSASLTDAAASVGYLRADRDGRLDLALAFQQLRSELGIRHLLCEGGPHLNGQLLAAGLVDELFLALAPKLAGERVGESLRIIAGVELEPLVAMQLLAAYEQDSFLFLRYRLGAGDH